MAAWNSPVPLVLLSRPECGIAVTGVGAKLLYQVACAEGFGLQPTLLNYSENGGNAFGSGPLLIFTTISVRSSSNESRCVKAVTSRQIRSQISRAVPSECERTDSSNRLVPNSVKSPLLASVSPSVYHTMTSPGCSLISSSEHPICGDIPTGMQKACGLNRVSALPTKHECRIVAAIPAYLAHPTPERGSAFPEQYGHKSLVVSQSQQLIVQMVSNIAQLSRFVGFQLHGRRGRGHQQRRCNSPSRKRLQSPTSFFHLVLRR